MLLFFITPNAKTAYELNSNLKKNWVYQWKLSGSGSKNRIFKTKWHNHFINKSVSKTYISAGIYLDEKLNFYYISYLV